jgi:methyltransferase family protein
LMGANTVIGSGNAELPKTQKDIFKRIAFSVHKAAARLGIHLIPKHYYSSFADLTELKRTEPQWSRASEMPGIRCSLETQREFLRAVAQWRLPDSIFEQAKSFGQGYGLIEARTLYGVIRHFHSRRVFEIGAGVSTPVIAAAKPDEHIIFEPFPSIRIAKQFSVERVPAQMIPISRFQELGPNDVLFIDSTHAVKPGSDVNYLVLEILPRLRPGVLVHFHDINFPYDYRPDLYDTLYQWAETSLLHAFLIGNSDIEMLCSHAMLHHLKPDLIKDVWPDYEPLPVKNGLFVAPRKHPYFQHFPCSLWLRTRSQPALENAGMSATAET